MVEADRDLRNSISSTLRREGYFVLALADGAIALEAAQDNPFSLIVLDPVLLRSGGPDLCRQLRAHPSTERVPILMLVTDDIEISQMVALELGVDDYITKPLRWEELHACVRELLRSGKPRLTKTWHRPIVGAIDGGEQVLVVGNLRIDVARRKVSRGDHLIELRSALLFDLLVYLARHRGVVFTRERLLAQVWGYERVDAIDTRTVDVHMRWLREKLEDDPVNPALIQTVRGVGYCLKE